MTDVLWLLGSVAVIVAGDLAMVGLHHLCLRTPQPRTRAGAPGVVADNGPARVRAQPPAGAPIRGDRAAPAGAGGDAQ